MGDEVEPAGRRRGAKFWLWLAAGVLLGGPLALVVAVLLAMNTGPGRRQAERLTAWASGGQVRIAGFSGRFPDDIRLDRLEVADARGVWLSAQNVALEWSAWRVFARDVRVEKLSVGAITVARAPVASGRAASEKSGLPVSVDVDRLEILDIALGPALAGAWSHFGGTASLHVRRFAAGARPVGRADVSVRRLGAAGDAEGHAVLSRAGIDLHLAAREPAGGFLSGAAGLPNLGAVSVAADLAGPWTAAALQLAVAAGPLRAGAAGTLDLNAAAGTLAVNASAPVMAPAPGLSWASVAIVGRLAGPFARPVATGAVDIAALTAGGARIGRVAARIVADRRTATLTGGLENIVLPAPNQNFLAQGVLHVSAAMRLDDARRPVTLRFDHPVLTGEGSAVFSPAFSGRLAVRVPDLRPVSGTMERAVEGHAGFSLAVARVSAATRIDLDAAMSVTGGDAPAAARGDTTLGATVTLDGADIVLSRLALDGTTLHAAATGSRRAGQVAAAWRLQASDLHEIFPALRGRVEASGRLTGTQQDFAADADVAGVVGNAGFAPAPLHLVVHGSGLPDRPAGTVVGTASVAGADAHLDLAAARGGDGSVRVAIGRAAWKSASVAGAFTLTPGATLPTGRVTLAMTRLDDARPLIGRALSGSVAATIDFSGTRRGAFSVDARGAGLPGVATTDRLTLDGFISDPNTRPVVTGSMIARGLHAGGVDGNLVVTASGPLKTPQLRIDGDAHALGGAELKAAATAGLDIVANTLTLASFRTDWHGETLTLAAPARVVFAPQVSVDRLRLVVAAAGAAPATLEVAGTATPTLALSVSGRGVTPGLARPFAPDVSADGVLGFEARLGGSLAAPTGTVRVAVDGLHARGGAAGTLPPVGGRAVLTLAGRAGQIDATIDAGRVAHFSMRGAVPLAGGEKIAVRAQGTMGLALLDPILTAAGRRVRGNLALDAAVTGTAAAPHANGTLRWTSGEVQDYAQGVHITDIAATLVASGDVLTVQQFSGRAGGGTIAVAGSVGLGGKMPVDLSITAENARPVTSDLVTATMDAALLVRGNVADTVAASGTIHVRRADIQVPDKLPGSVAVLDVRRAGERAPNKVAAAGVRIPLDITLDAPQQVFVRGHGLDAELGGSLHIGGSVANPQTSGAIELRRGEYSLAGQTLNFTSGNISFNGADKINPALDLVATSSNADILATLTVGGYASAPTIKLSSVPDRPQDEILAALLFHQSASSLGPFQLAQIGVALAQVSGIGGGGIDPISRLRNGLGLDRLSVGSSSTGGTVTTAVEAGRYVRPGIYVGAKQGTSGAETQAEVQIDIFKGLKLQTDAGSGPGGNTVGLTYQFQY